MWFISDDRTHGVRLPSSCLKKHLKFNCSGLSILEVLIATSIALITAYFMLALQLNQARENRALSERLAALELERTIISRLGLASQCSSLLVPTNIVGGLPKLTFDASTISPAHPYILELNTVWDLHPGESVSPLSSSLAVKLSGGLLVKVTSPTAATLHINFEQSKLMRPMKDLSFSISIASAGPPAATVITGCETSAGSTSTPSTREFILNAFFTKYVGGHTQLKFTWNQRDEGGNIPGSFHSKTFDDYAFGTLLSVNFYIGNGQFKLCNTICNVTGFSVEELPRVRNCRNAGGREKGVGFIVWNLLGSGRLEGAVSLDTEVLSLPENSTGSTGLQCEIY